MFTDRLGLAVISAAHRQGSRDFGIGWMAIRFGIAKRPARLGYRDMFALSVLSAVGCPVSLLVAEPALTNDAAVESAKAAVQVTC